MPPGTRLTYITRDFDPAPKIRATSHPRFHFPCPPDFENFDMKHNPLTYMFPAEINRSQIDLAADL